MENENSLHRPQIWENVNKEVHVHETSETDILLIIIVWPKAYENKRGNRKHNISCRNEDGGRALKEDRSCDGMTLSEGTSKPGTSGRNGPLTGSDGNISARLNTRHKETAVKGAKSSGQRQCPTCLITGQWLRRDVLDGQRSMPSYRRLFDRLPLFTGRLLWLIGWFHNVLFLCFLSLLLLSHDFFWSTSRL